jgi:predicted flap endonuclease-1-like 5' DNA nuclease
MPDVRFPTELTRVDVAKLDEAEKREIEGLYRTKNYLAERYRERIVEAETERDLLASRVERLERERETLRERLDQLDAERPKLDPSRVGSTFAEMLSGLQTELSGTDYAVGGLEIDLKANVVTDDDGVKFRLPDLAEEFAADNLSTLTFSLRPDGTPTTEAYEPIPDVRDQTRDAAASALQRAGFVVGDVTQEPGDEDDVVLDQFPSPHSVAEPGTAVDLTVSEHRRTTVPTLVGHTLKDALTILDAADLKVGEEDAETHEKPPETVIGQQPLASEEVPVGTRVDLTVSAGPPETDDEGAVAASVTDEDATTVERDADERDDERDADERDDERDDGTERTESSDSQEPTDGEESPDDPSLEAVSGIGPTYAGRLREAGIDRLDALIAADPDEVAAVTNAARSRVEEWFEHAKTLREGS